jgi:hypothetical protein
MTFTLEIELNNDGISNRSDLERAILRVAKELSFSVSQSFSSIPHESEHVLGEQGVIVGRWDVSDVALKPASTENAELRQLLSAAYSDLNLYWRNDFENRGLAISIRKVLGMDSK